MLKLPGLVTRIDPKTAKGITIDLVLVSPSSINLEIEAGSNLGSDHLLIIIDDNNPTKSSLSREKNGNTQRKDGTFFKRNYQI